MFMGILDMLLTILHYQNLFWKYKLENVYQLETKYKHSFLYKKIAKVISKKFHLGCRFRNVHRKICGNSF